MLSLMLVFASLSVAAQNTYRTEVELPFSFKVGNRSYDPGKYSFTINKAITGSSTMLIADEKNNVLQVTFVKINGERPSGELRFVFDKLGNNRFLNQIRTDHSSFELPKSKEHKLELANAADPETTTP